jgi:hypothetical protein
MIHKQIITIVKLLEGKKIVILPVGHSSVTYKKAVKHVKTIKPVTFFDSSKYAEK